MINVYIAYIDPRFYTYQLSSAGLSFFFFFVFSKFFLSSSFLNRLILIFVRNKNERVLYFLSPYSRSPSAIWLILSESNLNWPKTLSSSQAMDSHSGLSVDCLPRRLSIWSMSSCLLYFPSISSTIAWNNGMLLCYAFILKKHRSALAKLRCGVAPLHIETGRYVGRVLEDRVSFNCPMEVESEEHVILHCNV